MVRTGKKLLRKIIFTSSLWYSQKKSPRDRTVSRMELFNIVEVVIDQSIIKMAQHDGIYL
jgi:hypothetical protein